MHAVVGIHTYIARMHACMCLLCMQDDPRVVEDVALAWQVGASVHTHVHAYNVWMRALLAKVERANTIASQADAATS